MPDQPIIQCNPTPVWQTPLLKIPGYSPIKRPSIGSCFLNKALADELRDRGLVTFVEGDTDSSSADNLSNTSSSEELPHEEPAKQAGEEDKLLPEPQQESSEPVKKEEPVKAEEAWHSELLEFIKTSSTEDISQIKYIGKDTATELKEADPLTWEKVSEILSDRQISFAKAFIMGDE